MAASRAVVVIVGSALVFVGVAFAGYAVMLLLSPMLGAAASAAVTAAVLLVIPIGYLIVAATRTPPPAVVSPPNPETALLTVLARMAREQPLMAVLGAGLFGAAGVLFKPRR